MYRTTILMLGKPKIRKKGMKLTDLKDREHAIIMGFDGGYGFQRNLETMGVREGKEIEVLTKHPAGGPFVIRIDSMTLTIGKGMAEKIIVDRI